MTPLLLTIVRDHHDPIATVYLDAGSTSLLDETRCADPDLLLRALRMAGAEVVVVEDPVECEDGCGECRYERAAEGAS